MLEAARNSLAGFIAPKRLRKVRDATPIDFSPGFQSLFFGSGIGSHQPSHDALLQESIGVAATATRAIANRISSLNPQVMITKRQAEGTFKDEIIDDHPLKLLLDRPHPNYTRAQLLSLAAHHIVTVGEAYWHKVRSGLNTPVMLQPMPPGMVQPRLAGGVIEGYVVQSGHGQVIPLRASEVVRLWLPDPETLFSSEGYLGPNAAIADAQKFADQHLRAHYQHDATPRIILKADADAAEAGEGLWERFIAGWKRKHSNRHGQQIGLPAALPPGWDAILVAMASGADVTPLLEYWQSNQLMTFGTPASVLGRVVSGDRSAAETNQFVFDQHTILPIAAMIADAITLQLAPDFDPNIFVEFESFVSADKVFELTREAQDLTLKVKTVQQTLIERNEDPELAPWGELPIGTLADQPYTGEEREFPGFGGESPSDIEDPEDDDEDLDEDEQDTGDEEDDRTAPATRFRGSPELVAVNWEKSVSEARIVNREKRFAPRFARAIRRIFAAQRKDVLQRLADQRSRVPVNPLDPADLFDPKGWGPLFELETQALRQEAYLSAAGESLELMGITQEFDFNVNVAQQLRQQGAEMVKRLNKTTERRIRKALKDVLEEGAIEGETIKEMAKKIDEIFKGRRRNSATIARTEMHRATQSGQLESFKQAEIPFKQWLDSRDSNVRETHFQEGILPARREAMFTLPSGWMCMFPGDSRLPPEESVNCRCDTAPVFGIEEF